MRIIRYSLSRLGIQGRLGQVRKYYIESGDWRRLIEGEEFIAVLFSALQEYLSLSISVDDCFGTAILIGKRGFVSDLVYGGMIDYLSKEEIKKRSSDNIVITDLDMQMDEPEEEIIILSTSQVLKKIGYDGNFEDLPELN